MRGQCQKCGSSMSYEGRRQNNTNGHHWSVFHCPNCDTERLRG